MLLTLRARVVFISPNHKQGSLRAAIDAGMLEDRLSRRPNYLTVLSLALVSLS